MIYASLLKERAVCAQDFDDLIAIHIEIVSQNSGVRKDAT
jgi:superfamily I DNA/RNA helicase